MIADLHAHYPMRVINDMDPETAAKLMKAPGPTLRDRIQALVLKVANRIDNYPTWDGTYRITPETLREGRVAGECSRVEVCGPCGHKSHPRTSRLAALRPRA